MNNKLQEEIEYQKALRILRTYRDWYQDVNDPPSLRSGITRPTNDEIDWANALVALCKRKKRADDVELQL